MKFLLCCRWSLGVEEVRLRCWNEFTLPWMRSGGQDSPKTMGKSPKSWISTGYFWNSTTSSVTSGRFPGFSVSLLMFVMNGCFVIWRRIRALCLERGHWEVESIHTIRVYIRKRFAFSNVVPRRIFLLLNEQGFDYEHLHWWHTCISILEFQKYTRLRNICSSNLRHPYTTYTCGLSWACADRI